MEMLLCCLAFAAFVLAQAAALVAVHAKDDKHRPNAFDATPFAFAVRAAPTKRAARISDSPLRSRH